MKYVVALLLADRQHAERLANCLSSASVQPLLASHSDHLKEIIHSHPVDVLVIDYELCGFLTGIEILERLFADLVLPRTILISDPSQEVRERAVPLGVETVFPPNADPEVIADSVRDLLASTATNQLHIPSAARLLVQACGDIPPLPQLVVKLSSYLDAVDTVDIARLSDEILVDPRITADLLKLGNSAAIGARHKFTRVYDAIVFLGLRRTIALIISAATAHSQRHLSDRIPVEFRDWYNRRSVLNASTAAAFAGTLEGASADSAHILGLLQDIGVLLLAAGHGRRYCRLVERVRVVGQLRLANVEQQEFQVTHCEVSAALLQKWGLPMSFVSLVAEHHASGAPIERSPADAALLHTMRIGEAFADLADVCQPQRLYALDRLLARYGQKRARQCKNALSEAVARAVEAGKLLSIKVPDAREYTSLLQRVDEFRATNEAAIADANLATVAT